MTIQRTRYVVAPGERGWSIIRDGFGLESTHPTKAAAVRKAVTLAHKHEPSELRIHRQNGSVQEVRTYGSDPLRLIR